MNSQLIVHHPYRTLTELRRELPLASEEFVLAWSVINDHYLTDLPLLYPPHVIAVTAIVMAIVFMPHHHHQQQLQQQQQMMRTSASSPHPSAMAAAMRENNNSNNNGSDMAILAAAINEGNAVTKVPIRVQHLVGWLGESEVDIEAIVECTQELLSLYEAWELYSEVNCREMIGRMVKGRI